MSKETLRQMIASLLILLFSYASFSKLLEYGTFVTQLGKSPFIDNYAGVIAWLVPALELLIVALLLFKSSRLLGFYASFFLMTLFTAYIYMMLHFSYDLPCSCGGVLAEMSWQQHFVFNIAFTVLSLLGIIFQSSDHKISQIFLLNILLRSKQERR